MSRILVTGGAGFIGSHLVDTLVKRNHKVTVVDNLSVGNKKFVNHKAQFHKFNIQNPLLKNIFQKGKFDYVFHLAAQKNLQFSKNHPVEDAQTNIIGSLNIVSLSKLFKVKKIIFYSTAAVYDPLDVPPNKESDSVNPKTPYGIAKYAVEKYIQSSGLTYSIFRLSNVYGPRQDAEGEGGVVAIFGHKLAEGEAPTIYNSGRQTRDFIYVDDVVQASLSALFKGSNKTVNISTGRETSVNELFRRLQKIAEKNIHPVRGQKIKEQARSALANSVAWKTLHWKPRISLQNGLSKTYHFFTK